MSSWKKTGFGVLCICYGHFLWAQGTPNNTTTKTFTLTGSVGASANYYSSNETVQTRPTFSWNVYGNMVGRTGKWTLPLSFVVNQFNNSHSSPYVQAGISPTYNQWARFHLGYRYIYFSPLTYEGQSFRGVGVELYPKLFRFAAFYGRLNKAVNEDTTSGRYRVPQYSRTGYGVKIGIGDATRFIDLIYFHAKDDSSSASIARGSTRDYLQAQENAVVGTTFKLTFAKRWIWTGDAAVSGLVQDLSGKKVVDSSSQTWKGFISKFLPNTGNIASHYATQSSLSFYTRGYTGNIGYRRVQPGFKSLGTPYMIDDIELVSLINNFTTAKGKLNIGTNLSQQHNNLSKSLEAELRTQVGNVYVNTILGQHFNINLSFAGYNLRQRNDRNKLPDSLRLNDTLLLRQQISQYSFVPSYNITKGNNIHYISSNLTLQTLKDKNPKTAAQTNSRNFSSSLTYTIAFINRPYSFSINYLHSRYKQTANSYTSNGATLGASAQLLKSRRWNVQGNFGLFSNKFNNLSGTQKNTTYSLSSGYQGRHHALNLFVNYIYTPPNNAINEAIAKAIPYALANKYVYGGVTYSYSFR
jgi:hypothetical protein